MLWILAVPNTGHSQSPVSESFTPTALPPGIVLRPELLRLIDRVDNTPRRVALQQVVTDPLAPLQWHLQNPGASTDYPWEDALEGADINAFEAWSQTQGSEEIVIAVLDTGLDLEHPEFQDRVLPGWDFVDGDADASFPGPTYAAAHGTCVAGVLGAAADGAGVVGVCPRCQILPIRLIAHEGTIRDGDLVAAIAWAAERADVIVASWSYLPQVYIPQAMHDAIRWAAVHGRDGRGVSVVFAAGNRAQEIEPYAPQALPEVFSIGATTAADTRASYSNTGPSLTLMAPGGRQDGWIDSVRQRYGKVVTADVQGEDGYNPSFDEAHAQGVVTDTDYSAAFWGTSASAPVVAGAVGLLLSADPTLTRNEIFWLLSQTAQKLGSVTYSDGFHPDYGYGRLDIGAAMTLWASGAYCQEVAEDCENGLDDDCDRAVDAADQDCGAQLPPVFEVPLGQRCNEEMGDLLPGDPCADGFCASAEGLNHDDDTAPRYCTALCDFDCPGNGFCVGLEAEGRCLPRCVQNADCPSEQICSVVAPELRPPGYPSLAVCVSRCASDADCRSGSCEDGACRGPARQSQTVVPRTGCSGHGAAFGGVWVLIFGLYRRRGRGYFTGRDLV